MPTRGADSRLRDVMLGDAALPGFGVRLPSRRVDAPGSENTCVLPPFPNILKGCLNRGHVTDILEAPRRQT